jgi:hypothetical protein
MTKKKTTPPLQVREQYYIKRGKRYFPVNDPGAYDGLGQGAWMVIVDKNCTSIRTVVNPKFIELDAALKYLEEGLCRAIAKASEMRPTSEPIGEKEQNAWKAFRTIMGKDMPRYFQYASFSEISQKGCEYIRKIMLENNMDVAKIKKKYEIVKKECKNTILGLEIE